MVEPEGFAQWLGRYCRSGGGRVPKAGTPLREDLAELYDGLKSAGVAPVADDVPPRVRCSPRTALLAIERAAVLKVLLDSKYGVEHAGIEPHRLIEQVRYVVEQWNWSLDDAKAVDAFLVDPEGTARRVGSFLFEWAPVHTITVTEPMIAEALRRVASLLNVQADPPEEYLPESVCHRCEGPNPLSWFAPSPLWNAVMRGGSIDGPEDFGGIVCPTCFCGLAVERGIASYFVVDAREVHVELETVTPSGRVWDPEAMMWVDPPEQGDMAAS